MKIHPEILCIAAVIAVAPSVGLAQGQIDAGPNLNAARMAHHVARLPDGRVAVFGGHGPGFVSLTTAEIWTPSANSFSSLPMVFRHDVPAFARLADGRYLVAGGSASLGIPADATSELFDPQTGTFTATGSMVRFRAMAGAACLKSGRVLIAGGWWTHNDAHTYGELFDLATGVFAATGGLNVPRANPVVIPTEDGQAVVVGGYGYTGSSLAPSPEIYDPVANTFTLVRSGLFPGEEGWTVGGIQETIETTRLANGRYLLLASRAATEYTLATFDPVSKEFARFETTSPLPAAAAEWLWSPLVDAANNRAYLLGIVSQASPSQVVLHTVNLATGEMKSDTVPGQFPNAYSLAGASQTLLADGRIMVVGGTTGNNFGAVPYTVFVKPAEDFSLQIAMYAGIQIRGKVGASYRIEYVDQAGDPNWTVLTTLALPASPYLYVDTTSTNAQKRIYRAVRVD